jgi:hypothetical protein
MCRFSFGLVDGFPFPYKRQKASIVPAMHVGGLKAGNPPRPWRAVPLLLSANIAAVHR